MGRRHEARQEVSTTVVLAFPWGRYHATPWGRHVNEAEVDWPPSPWRLLRALYATWQDRAPELPQAVVHGLLSRLAEEHPSYRLPPSTRGHTRHYMPDGHRDPQQIMGREGTDKVLDGFRVVERNAEVLVTWPVDLVDEQREGLARLVERLPYLGRSESLVDGRLLAAPPTAEPNVVPLVRDARPDGPMLQLLAPRRPLDLAALTVTTTEVRAARYVVPPGADWADFSPLAESELTPSAAPRRPAPTVTALRFALAAPALPGRRLTVAVAERLRSAAQSRYGELFDGGSSRTLSGKGDDGRPLSGHRHAHWLPLDADGDKLLDTAVLWAGDGLDPGEIAACARIDRVIPQGPASGFQPLRVVLVGVGSVEEVGSELVGPAAEWESVTPFAPPRHAKRAGLEEHVASQVAEELERRAKPAAEVDVVRGDWLSYRRHRVTTKPPEHLEDGRNAVGVRLRFERPVDGPLALGALSHFGLGLFRPVG